MNMYLFAYNFKLGTSSMLNQTMKFLQLNFLKMKKANDCPKFYHTKERSILYTSTQVPRKMYQNE